MKFNQGDKVVVVSVDAASAPYHKVGSVLTVCEIRVGTKDFIYYFLEKPNNGLYGFELKLASEPVVSTKFEFGMLVKVRDGELLMVVKEDSSDCLMIVSEDGGWSYIDDYDPHTLKHKSNPNLDILEVYSLSRYVHRALEFNTSTRELLWEADSIKVQELTVEEVSKRLGYDVKIVK